jgi:flagellar hook-associated protein FlgK
VTQQQMNELIGEIVAINEEIAEFAAQGDNVQPLIAERNGLVRVLEWAIYKINAAPGATGTANASY